MKSTVALVVSFFLLSLLTACSSSSPPSKAECFTGAFDVTFGAEANGDARCPDLSAKTAQWVYIANDKTVSASAPKGTTQAPGANVFDENTCKATEEFTKTEVAPGCTVADAYFFDLAFDAKGLTGTYRFIGCGASDPDAGAGTPAVEYLDCTYPVTGTKQQ